MTNWIGGILTAVAVAGLVVGVGSVFGFLPLTVAQSQCPGFAPAVCPQLWFATSGYSVSGWANGSMLNGVTLDSVEVEIGQNGCGVNQAMACPISVPVSVSMPTKNQWMGSFSYTFAASAAGNYTIRQLVGYHSCCLNFTMYVYSAPVSTMMIPSNTVTTPCTLCPSVSAAFVIHSFGLFVNIADASSVVSATIVPAQFVWNLGDGTIVNGQDHVNHTYSVAGTYAVSEQVAALDSSHGLLMFSFVRQNITIATSGPSENATSVIGPLHAQSHTATFSSLNLALVFGSSTLLVMAPWFTRYGVMAGLVLVIAGVGYVVGMVV